MFTLKEGSKHIRRDAMTWLGDLFKWVGYQLVNIGCHIADRTSLDEYLLDKELTEWLEGNVVFDEDI